MKPQVYQLLLPSVGAQLTNETEVSVPEVKRSSNVRSVLTLAETYAMLRVTMFRFTKSVLALQGGIVVNSACLCHDIKVSCLIFFFSWFKRFLVANGFW